MRRKITVVGAGDVGAATARLLAEREYANVVLMDAAAGAAAAGRVRDINDAGPVMGYEPRVTATASFIDTAGSDVVVVACRTPGGEARKQEAVVGDRKAVGAVARELALTSPDAIVIVADAPAAAMCHVALAETLFPRRRVMGMAGVLDAARLRAAVAAELGVSARDVAGLVLGGQGDSMVPVLSHTTVAGAPVADMVEGSRLREIVERTRAGVPGAAHAPAAAVRAMVDAIVLDRRCVLSCAALCQGEFGIDGLFTGVPVRLGHGGIEEIVEIRLQDEELQALRDSAAAVRELVDSLAELA